MSRKQKLETLAALGVLKDQDVRHIQGRLSRRPKAYSKALLGLWTIVGALALANAVQSGYIWWHLLSR